MKKAFMTRGEEWRFIKMYPVGGYIKLGIFVLTDLLLAALDLQLQSVLQVLLQALLRLDLLLQEQDLRLQLLLHVIGRRPQCHQVLTKLSHCVLKLLADS